MSSQPRQWTIDADPFFVDDEEELAHALGEAVTILTRIGGALMIVAQREEVAPDLWQTTGFAFKWSSYAPGKRASKQPEVEPSGSADDDA